MNAPALRPSPITPTVDFDRDGVQHGHLKLPYSRDDSAWGAIMQPISVIKNGDGPTVLFTGANHGDEYEGVIAIMELANSLKAEDITGRVILVPALNYPAFKAGKRTSPIDGGNMNRIFPGKPDGTVTQKIADYFERHLVPKADLVADIHSGGKTLEFVPFAAAHYLEDKEQEARCVAAMQAFNAPYSMMMLEIDSVGMLDSSVEEKGKTFVTTELGGGGSTTAKTVAIAKKGLRNLLVHSGVLRGALETSPTQMLDMPDGSCFVTAEEDGLLEPCVDLGEPVEKGQVVARVYETSRSGKPPRDYHAGLTGVLAGRHFPGLVQAGDSIAVVGVVTG